MTIGVVAIIICFMVLLEVRDYVMTKQMAKFQERVEQWEKVHSRCGVWNCEEYATKHLEEIKKRKNGSNI